MKGSAFFTHPVLLIIYMLKFRNLFGNVLMFSLDPLDWHPSQEAFVYSV